MIRDRRVDLLACQKPPPNLVEVFYLGDDQTGTVDHVVNLVALSGVGSIARFSQMKVRLSDQRATLRFICRINIDLQD